MPFSSNIGDEAEIEAASNNVYSSGGPLWTRTTDLSLIRTAL